MSQILVANSRRGSAAMGMAPSGWVNWWCDFVTCLPTTLFPSLILISHIPMRSLFPLYLPLYRFATRTGSGKLL
jgi:hypothetical protein